MLDGIYTSVENRRAKNFPHGEKTNEGITVRLQNFTYL